MAPALISCTLLLAAASAMAGDDSRVEAGRALAHDFEKGNCLACHAAPADPIAVTKANIGPPLVGMRKRFKERKTLRQQIWDAAARNPDTIMPPFGRHLILSDDEIELIIDYVYTL